MAESRVPVDLLNPGQVFACLGLMEAAEVLLGDVAAVFEWSDRETRATFRVVAAGEEKPVDRVMRFLEEAEIVAREPARHTYLKWEAKWGKKETDPSDISFPFPAPDSSGTLPAVLRDEGGDEITIDYWGDRTRRGNVKFWAGSSPGVAILQETRESVRGKIRQHANDPFILSAPQPKSLRFDRRRDYVPIQVGFSPNNHPKDTIRTEGFPLVDILGAIGVTNARPAARTSRLEYLYGVLGGRHPVDVTFIRAALGGEESPVPGQPFRRFVMRLDWPGKEGVERCITQAVEANH